MNKFFIIIFILLALTVGFAGGNMAKKGTKATNNPNSKLAAEVIGNPIVTYLTLDGKVVAVDSESVTLEKDGKQLKAYFGKDSTFAKIPSTEELGATPTATTAISELPIGSEVTGGAKVQKDANSNDFKIYTELFYVK